MRVAICDDEAEVINKLTGYINRFASEYGNIKIKKFNSAEDVVEYYKTNGNVFDVLITDIELGSADGVELAGWVRNRDENVYIFFITSHTEYAIRCFRPCPMNFWVKPLSYEQFCDDFNRVVRLMQRHNEYIEIISERTAVRLRCSDIIYIEREKRRTVVHTREQQYITSKSLAEFENELDPERFIRIYQSDIINLEKVKRVIKKEVELDGIEGRFEIGRIYMSDFKRRYIRFKEGCVS